MPVCVQCGTPCPSLFTVYSQRNYALRECHHCFNLADPFIDGDFTLKFVDLLLLKAPALRHLVYNADQWEKPKRLIPPVIRIGLAVVLIDAFGRWTNSTLFDPPARSQNDRELILAFVCVFGKQVLEYASLLLYLTTLSWIYLKASNPRSRASRVRKLPLAVFYASLPRLALLFILFVWRKRFEDATVIAPDILPRALLRVLPQMRTYQWYVESVRVGFGSAACLLALSVVLITQSVVVPVAILAAAQFCNYLTFGRV